jgi:hypothetical protein
MAASALFMGLLGLAASFMPQEILRFFDAPVSLPAVVLLQITGALYLGFAFLNWMARGILIGGIYARPLGLGNFMHFAVVTVTFLKIVGTQSSLPLLAAAAVYAAIALWFGLVLFTHPGSASQD